ncbi:hypothetical protein HUU59_07865 [bacterium]|nr:hypothetical protein [bacterium]
MALLRARATRTRRPVRHAVEKFAGWYFTRSIQSYQYLQTGELPPSVVRDRLKMAVIRLSIQRQRIINKMRLRGF